MAVPNIKIVAIAEALDLGVAAREKIAVPSRDINEPCSMKTAASSLLPQKDILEFGNIIYWVA